MNSLAANFAGPITVTSSRVAILGYREWHLLKRELWPLVEWRYLLYLELR